jgi:uncharacterized membrane protein (DUF4010 family)
MYLWARNRIWAGLSSDLHTVLKSLTISTLIQVLLLLYTIPVLYPVRNHVDQHPWRLAGWAALSGKNWLEGVGSVRLVLVGMIGRSLTGLAFFPESA